MPELPVEGPPDVIKQWAVNANAAIRKSAEKVNELLTGINTIGKWKLSSLTRYLSENSTMRMLEEVAGFDHLNTTSLVTVADNGTFRVFERVHGVITKGK